METIIQDIQTTRYAQLSSGFLIIFDHLITFDDEVALIWNSAWSPGKILFLINRYYNLGGILFNIYALFVSEKSHELYVAVLCVRIGIVLSCYFEGLRLFQWQGWTGILAFMMAEAILQLRIYALYSLNKRMLVAMLILYFACTGCSAWIVITELSSISITAPVVPAVATLDGSFCIPLLLPRGIFRYWIPMLSYECLLCILVLFQGFRRFRSDSSIFLSGKRLVDTLIRDSIIYFLVIFVTYLTCLLVWAFARRSFLEVPIGFSVTMSCVMANRVVLNCRKISRRVQVCTVTRANGRTVIVADENDDDGDDGITNDVGGKKGVLSVSEEEGVGGLGTPTMPILDFQWP